MDSPEKLAALGTQDTRRRQEKQKSQHNMCWTPSYTKTQDFFNEKKKIYIYNHSSLVMIKHVMYIFV